MKIAVLGAGISGITCAYLLAQEHEVHLFEKNDYLGGHTNTRIVTDADGREIPVDTGFIVCNPKNYPNFFKLMKLLHVPFKKSDMSFGFCDIDSGFSYLGPSFAEFMRQPENFFSKTFLRFVYEQRKFNMQALKDLKNGVLKNELLGDYLRRMRVSSFLKENYITPLISSIWSSPEFDTDKFPALTFVAFFKNHSMLNFMGRPKWRTIENGSHSYVKAFKKKFGGVVHIEKAITSVARDSGKVTVSGKTGNFEFDKVILATHADESLKLLSKPTETETKLLSGWRYSRSLAVLHCDSTVLPTPRRQWAAWNYMRDGRPAEDGVSITYYMNRLQNIKSKTDFFVTLNPRKQIEPSKIFYQTEYEHPVYTPNSINTQIEIQNIQGENNTYYCGAYLGYGFHEDGVNAALNVTKHFGIYL